MAATSAGHTHHQYQQQQQQQQQQKLNHVMGVNGRSMQQPLGMHNMHQQHQNHQPNLMQQYALKQHQQQQQQHVYAVQQHHQQLPNHYMAHSPHQTMQHFSQQQHQMHYKVPQQQQQSHMSRSSEIISAHHRANPAHLMSPTIHHITSQQQQQHLQQQQHMQQQQQQQQHQNQIQLNSQQEIKYNLNATQTMQQPQQHQHNQHTLQPPTRLHSPQSQPLNPLSIGLLNGGNMSRERINNSSIDYQQQQQQQQECDVNMMQRHQIFNQWHAPPGINQTSTTNKELQEQQQQHHHQQQHQQHQFQQQQQQQQLKVNNVNNLTAVATNSRLSAVHDANESNATKPNLAPHFTHHQHHHNQHPSDDHCSPFAVTNMHYSNTHSKIPNDVAATVTVQQQQPQQQHQQQHHQQHLQQQQQQGNKANLAPGWRRLANNNDEIVYVSPTGATLRSPFQIKDYLLSPGTCKCGLPCPLRPEYFFDFDVQAPNIPLTMPAAIENDGFNSSSSLSPSTDMPALSLSSTSSSSASSSSSLQFSASLSTPALSTSCRTPASPSSVIASSSASSVPSATSGATIPSPTMDAIDSSRLPAAFKSLTCLHQKRFLDSQQLHAQPLDTLALLNNNNKDAKRRKLNCAETITNSDNSNNQLSPLLYRNGGGSDGDGGSQQSSQTYQMLPPASQQPQLQHHRQHQPHLNHRAQQLSQQEVIMKSEIEGNTTNAAHNDDEDDGNQGKSLCSNKDHHDMKVWLSHNDRVPLLSPQIQNELNEHEATAPHTAIKDHFHWPSSNDEDDEAADISGLLNESNINDKDLETSLKENLVNDRSLLNSIINVTVISGSEMQDVENSAKVLHEEDESLEGTEEREVNESDRIQDTLNTDILMEESNENKTHEFFAAHNGSKNKDAFLNEIALEADNEQGEDDENENENEEDDEEEEENEDDASEEGDSAEEIEPDEITDTQKVINGNSTINTKPVPTELHPDNSNSLQQVPNSYFRTQTSSTINQYKTVLPSSQTKIFMTQSNAQTCYGSKTAKPMPQQNTNYRTANDIGNTIKTPIRFVSVALESPVSSSTINGPRITPDSQCQTPDGTKKPEQVGAISTSHESPRPCPPSPAGSVESNSSRTSTVKTAPSPVLSPMIQQPSPIQLRLHSQPLTSPPQSSPQSAQQPQQVRIVRHIKSNSQQLSNVSTHQRIIAAQTPSSSTRTTVTTIAGNRGAATTTTTTSGSQHRFNVIAPTSTPSHQKIQATLQKITTSASIPVNQLQLQPILKTNETASSQIIMTSTGQLIVMPATQNKQSASQQQVLITANGGGTTLNAVPPSTANVIIQQQGTGQVEVLNGAGQLTTTLQPQHSTSYIVSQATATSGTSSQLQPTTVILNSTGQNILTSNGTKVFNNTGNILQTTGNQSIITTGNHLITTPNTVTTSGVHLGPQTVVLNNLTNGSYVIHQQQPQSTANAATTTQQQFTSLDGQMVSQIQVQPQIGTYLQPTGCNQQRIFITSHGQDMKRRAKKRKNSTSPTHVNGPQSQQQQQNLTSQISTPMSTQTTTTILQQHNASQQQQATGQTQVVQLTAAPSATTATAYHQQFQLGSGIQGIVVNKPATAGTPQAPAQQILFQNGQIIQPMNLIGQQLLVPASLVMRPETTLLQLQNVGATTTNTILTAATTPQGTMMLRAASPQTNKQFISTTAAGQQFIVGSNGQLSPINQIYSTPMGLVMPAAAAAAVQQNAVQNLLQQQQNNSTTTIQMQQPHQQQQQQQQQQQHLITSQQQSVTLHTIQQQQQHLNMLTNDQVGVVLETTITSSSPSSVRSAAASPPDTTTHSPRSPERPASHRSTDSDMVQCVSSSEPDGGVSPQSSDSRQSPSTTDCEKGVIMSTAYQNTNIYKPTEVRIRRVQTPPQYQILSGVGVGSQTTGLTNLGLLQQQQQQQQQKQIQIQTQHQHQHQNGNNSQPDSHDSPQSSPTTTVVITPPPPLLQQKTNYPNMTPPPSPQQSSQYQHLQQQSSQLKMPMKQTRNRAKSSIKSNPRLDANYSECANVLNNGNKCGNNVRISSPPPLALSLQYTFSVGELIWGPARGYPAWPGKIVKIPDRHGDTAWVQWFGGGGRSNSELMAVHLLQSLSDGLEAHHKAQKDTRKSRKLNSQLERAIQEAMTELDRISANSTTKNTNSSSSSSSSNSTHNNNNKQIQQATSSIQNYQQINNNNNNRANKRPIPRTGGYNLISPRAGSNATAASSSTNGATSTTSIANSNTNYVVQSRQKHIRIAPAPSGGLVNSSTPIKSTMTLANSQILNK